MQGKHRLQLRRNTSLVALGLAIACGGQAMASEVAAGDAAAPQKTVTDQEIVVTGSRIARSGFNTPTPTTVMSSEMLDRQGQINVADFLNQIPAARNSGTTATQNLSFRAGAGGNYINLRGIGAVRTLVLFDGQRVVPTTTTGLVDLNIVPSIMVDRTEVVTGGASAAYGSDAVSGVVNLILKKNFNGFRADVQGGTSQYGDNNTINVGAVGGFKFGSGGHVLIGGDYAKNTGVGTLTARDWSARAGGTVVGANGVRYQVNDLQTNNQTYGGIVVSGPLKGLAFADAGGAPYTFAYGNVFGNPNSTTQQGGTNPQSFNYNPADLNVPFSRYSGMMRIDYEFSQAFKVNATFNYAHTGGSRPTVYARDTNIVVQRDNAFLPASVVNQMISSNVQTITVGRINRDIGSFDYTDDNNLYRAGLAAEGDLGGSFKYDAYVNYGKNHATYDYTARIDGAMPGDPAGTKRFLNAADSVRNSSGQIVCRVNLVTTVSPGCVPFDIFGEQTLTAAQKAWLIGTQHVVQDTEQTAFGVNLHATPFSTWAGPASIAVGGEHRGLSQNVAVDGGSLAGAFNLGNTQPATGSFTVTEGYGEVLLPLLKDAPLAKSVELDSAVRRTHYSISGSVTTWKAGLNWAASDDIRLRLTRSRDIRAPNLTELFQPLTRSVNLVNLPGGSTLLLPNFIAGNNQLKPEVANTLSFGTVITPRAIPGLRLSVDYYDIQISGAITSLTGQAIVSGCLVNNIADYCSKLSNNGVAVTSSAGPVTSTTLANISPVNLNKLRTSGIDVELAYGFELGKGRLDLSTYATYVTRMTTTDPLGSFNRAGEIGLGIINQGTDTPHLTASANINYHRDAVNLLANVRLVGGASLDKLAAPGQVVGPLSVPAIVYLNLSFDWTVKQSASSKLVVFGGIDNVFNTDPPSAITYQEFFNGGAGAYYDVIGRRFRLGARVQF